MIDNIVLRLKEFMENEARRAPWILGALHLSMFIGCGEDKCHSMRLRRHCGFKIHVSWFRNKQI